MFACLPQFGDYVQLGRNRLVSHLNLSVSSVLDAGRYTCEARNSAGSARHDGRVRVAGPTRIKRMRDRLAVAEQSDVWLPCELVGNAPASIYWQKGAFSAVLTGRH
jgi:hypothetical protein